MCVTQVFAVLLDYNKGPPWFCHGTKIHGHSSSSSYRPSLLLHLRIRTCTQQHLHTAVLAQAALAHSGIGMQQHSHTAGLAYNGTCTQQHPCFRLPARAPVLARLPADRPLSCKTAPWLWTIAARAQVDCCGRC